MSYSTAYLMKTDGQIEEAAEWRNGHGTGPRVWTAVGRRFLGKDYWQVLNGKDDRRFWDLWKDPRLPRAWRAALLATYDHAIIEHARFREVAGLLRAFSVESMPGVENHVNHLPAWADLLDAHADDLDVLGMCLQCTSVAEDQWFTWDEEKGESIPYDARTGTLHFFVGASLDKVDATARAPEPRG